MRLVEDEQLGLGGATELGEQRGSGLRGRAADGRAVANRELAQEAERPTGTEGGGDPAEVAGRQAGAERVEHDRLPRARRRDEQRGAARVDGEAQPLEGFAEARV